MEKNLVQKLNRSFEEAAYEENGVEYWLARDLQILLEYTQWRNFEMVIEKAKTACENSGHSSDDHFADVSKMVDIGSGSQRQIDDVMLSRYACYLIAQNGDPVRIESPLLKAISPSRPESKKSWKNGSPWWSDSQPGRNWWRPKPSYPRTSMSGESTTKDLAESGAKAIRLCLEDLPHCR